MSRPRGYATMFGLFANSGPVRDIRALETLTRRTETPVNDRPELVPYVYRGQPPSHPGLCDGCGMLDQACRCAKIG